MRLAQPILAILLLAIASAPPGEVTAQRAVADSLAHADSLRQIALELQADPETFYRAAIAYKDAARYRAPTDVTAVDGLIVAGHLLYAVGEAAEALDTFERAAERARALGDVERAAEAYLDAAFVADALDDRDEVERLGTSAEMLTSSPLLTAEQRDRILRRIHRAPSGDAMATAASRADSVHQEALRAQADMANWEAAGRLFVTEADLRPAGDLRAVDVMIVAANLFYGAKLPLRARRVLEAAGERAEAAGDPLRAARAYLDAATVAQRGGDEGVAAGLVERARILSESPLLSSNQRDRILRRIGFVGGPEG
ncbi:MAG: hypothetical protein ABFS34_06890 [Gemmatimonadota bacterium]